MGLFDDLGRARAGGSREYGRGNRPTSSKAQILFERGRAMLSNQEDGGIECIMEAIGAGSSDAALYVADIYLDLFIDEYPHGFSPRYNDIDNAKTFCNFHLIAEYLGASESQLRPRLSRFLSCFSDNEDIDYFQNEIYLPLRMQIFNRLRMEGL